MVMIFFLIFVSAPVAWLGFVPSVGGSKSVNDALFVPAPTNEYGTSLPLCLVFILLARELALEQTFT